jgi:hypothetical protein
LTTAVCLHPEVWEKPESGPCEFHVRIDGRLAFVLSIDPVHLQADRRWHQLSLPVPESTEGRHQIIFETRAGGSGRDFRWAIWRDPAFCWQGQVGSTAEAGGSGREQEAEGTKTANVEERTNA